MDDENIKKTDDEKFNTQELGFVKDSKITQKDKSEILDNMVQNKSGAGAFYIKENIHEAEQNAENNLEERKKEETEKNKKTKKEKKPKTLKQIILSRIIFILIFAIIVAGITYYFVNTKEEELPPEEIQISEQIEEIEQSSYKTSNLSDMYYTNPIKIEEIKEDYNGFSEGITYLKIDGLRNETVENKINEKIKDVTEKTADEFLANNYERYNLYTYATGNFSNILSIYIHVNAMSGEKYKVLENTINFNLNDGSEIKLDDLFVSKKAVKSFLINTMYNPIIEATSQMDENDWNLRPTEESAYAEDEIYKFILDYENEKEIKFAITPKYLKIYLEGYEIDLNLPFAKQYKNVIVYNRFITEKELYDGKYEKVGPFHVFTEENDCTKKYFEYTENNYMNVVYSDYEEKNEKVQNTIDKFTEDYIAYRKEIFKQSNQFGVSSINFGVHYNNYNSKDTYDLYIEECYFYTNKKEFENNILPKILDFMRTSVNYEMNTIIPFHVAVDYYENEWFYIEINKNGEIVKDSRNEETPWLIND